MLRGLGVSSIRETTLAANQWLSDAVRLEFISETQSSERQSMTHETADEPQTASQWSKFNIHPEVSRRQYRKTTYKNSQRRADTDPDVFQITLQPMQIRTFILNF